MNRESKSCLILFCALAAAAPGLASAQAAKPPAKPRADEPVGRLFFTPAQRASLDVARIRRARTTLNSEDEQNTPVAQTITYGGMVRRSDGKSTMWVNNRAISDNEAAGGPIIGQVRPDGSVTLSLPQSGRSVDLKPGQSVELLSGTIEEGFSRKPVAPEPKPANKPVANAKTEKPVATDREERLREERQQERLQEAISEALRETAAARSNSAPTAPVTQPAP